MPQIFIPQRKITLDAPAGANLMTFLLNEKIPVASSCLGDGVCSKCRMKIKGHLPAPTDFEKAALARNKCAEDERLSCQITVATDLEIATTYW